MRRRVSFGPGGGGMLEVAVVGQRETLKMVTSPHANLESSFIVFPTPKHRGMEWFYKQPSASKEPTWGQQLLKKMQ